MDHADVSGNLSSEPRRAFDEIVASHGPALWRLATYYAGQRADQEDLYQEILVAIWRALPHFRGDASYRTFVFRIGHNRGLTNRARHAARRRRECDVPDELPDHRPTAEESLDRELDVARLTEAIRSLAPSLAQPLLLQLEGFSHAEIGDVLGITANNAGVRLHRARSALADILGRKDRS